MANLLNIIKHKNKLLDKVFFYGDYLAHQTESGKEDSGIRLVHNVDRELIKEEVEELYNLIVASSEMLEMLKKLHESCPNHRGDKRRKLGELIAKAEGHE